jgi:hypothetical protein
MRRFSPAGFPLVLIGALVLLSLFGAGAGVVSFILLRAGYGFVVWGMLPLLTLIVVGNVVGVAAWRLAGGRLRRRERSDGVEDKLRGNSRRGGPNREDDV